jgi:hypothetical protein
MIRAHRAITRSDFRAEHACDLLLLVRALMRKRELAIDAAERDAIGRDLQLLLLDLGAVQRRMAQAA